MSETNMVIFLPIVTPSNLGPFERLLHWLRFYEDSLERLMRMQARACMITALFVAAKSMSYLGIAQLLSLFSASFLLPRLAANYRSQQIDPPLCHGTRLPWNKELECSKR